ncbi:hypothetical protein F5882DRAFT_432929 [Hyaloscypha sp. PMI_1271]|nr:hypothetical protein F5882DRAFT_432929 [Hyaloscypha sp. PMI_1271]
MPTWFLPPDFTFTSEGPIKLGTVLAHPSQPTLVLASLPGDSGITLPKEMSLNIWTKFLEVATASAKTEAGRKNFESYGIVDHEIRSFVDPFTRSTATAITTLPDVKSHINTGTFGKKSDYIVTGLRIAKRSFTVTKEVASNLSGEISGSGPSAGGTVPPVGPVTGQESTLITKEFYLDARSLCPNDRKTIGKNDFKSRVVRVRNHSFGRTIETSTNPDAEQPLVVAEATKEEVEEDLEEQVRFETSNVGEDEHCISF